jgi:hypothetical protein
MQRLVHTARFVILSTTLSPAWAKRRWLPAISLHLSRLDANRLKKILQTTFRIRSAIWR